MIRNKFLNEKLKMNKPEKILFKFLTLMKMKTLMEENYFR